MNIPAGYPRLAVLASCPERRDALLELCRTTLEGATVEPMRDMVELVIRVATADLQVVLVDGTAPACLPADGAVILKGLRPSLQVVVIDIEVHGAVLHGVDVKVDRTRLTHWLTTRFSEVHP